MTMWNQFVERYRQGEWRTPIFRDMILTEMGRFREAPTVLDIGCGGGFDSQATHQQELAESSGQYLGIEPDPNIKLGPYFSEAWRSVFEAAAVPTNSVDVAFAV